MPMASATITLSTPVPKIASSMIASRTPGKLTVRSTARITSASIHPPRSAETRPSSTPAVIPAATATTATSSDIRSP